MQGISYFTPPIIDSEDSYVADPVQGLARPGKQAFRAKSCLGPSPGCRSACKLILTSHASDGQDFLLQLLT
jgi:hypothetical protein